VPEEISQTLLTIRSKEKTAMFMFISMENKRSPLENFKTSRDSYLGLDLSIHFII
jgi:hypothetical protein